MNPVAREVVDAEDGRVGGGRVGRCLREAEGKRVLGRRVQGGNIVVVDILPRRAARAERRYVPVRLVGASALEDRVGGVLIDGGDVVATEYLTLMTGEALLGGQEHSQAHPRRKHDRVAVLPRNRQRIVCHGAAPGHADPADLVRGHQLDDGLIRRLIRVRDGDVVLDAEFHAVRGEDDARPVVLDDRRVRRRLLKLLAVDCRCAVSF